MNLKDKLATFSEYDLRHRGILRLHAAKQVLTPRIMHACWHQRPRHFIKAHQEHSHDVYHLVLIEEGRGTFSYRGKPCPVRKGSLLLISPGETHALENLQNDTTVFSEVTFQLIDDQDRAATIGFIEWLQVWSGLPGFKHTQGAKLSPHFCRELSLALSRLVDLRLYKQQQHPFFLHTLWQAAMEILVRALNSDLEALKRDDPVETARHLIRMEAPHPVRIPEIARQVGLSANYLARSFKARYGVTPIRYHQVMRIEVVKTLLLYTRAPLKSIAAQTGFSDEYYLARLFHKIEGMPPGKFRFKPRRPTSARSY